MLDALAGEPLNDFDPPNLVPTDTDPMPQDLSIVQLLLNASWVVQAVVALLVVVSIISWAAIFRKVFALKRVNATTKTSSASSGRAPTSTTCTPPPPRARATAGPMERIFASGMREYQKLRERRITDAGALLDGARRAMRASFQRELDALETNLSFLGTVGSVAPYVGLFGTVWGIMHAFTGLAALAQVTLATVAPGIAEALVATAIGLFAAIPAVVAYNRFATDIDRVANRMETFMEEFSNILQRNLGSSPPGHPPRATEHGSRLSRAVGPSPHQERDQHGPVHRRDAGAADHLHGHRTADLAEPDQPAQRGPGRRAAQALCAGGDRQRRAHPGAGWARPARPSGPGCIKMAQLAAR